MSRADQLSIRVIKVSKRAGKLFGHMRKDPSLFKAEGTICFDSKRILGCYVCPLYKCDEREL